ncbi:MarR family transcriptional regulator [Nonomuraea sp. K274]|uniref:MarR family transcriptional regulator n=1 Tax=Nonomuraea cypriaca TaxID=1187855 RepID=A0A931F6A6_9ACTN|nr:MarR family transcriptional regulator [Nonomuraea cypriaca]MBF8192951.1 MarR family transcriptional regulator [Nonomuraea cypriaca]
MSTRGAAARISSATGYLLMRLGDVARLRTEEELARWDITGKELRVLAYAHGAAMSQRDLTTLARMDRTTMTAVINRLEERGRVQRVRNPADRRKYLITITEEGTRLVEEALAHMAEVEAGLLGPLTPIERSLLNNMVTRLFAAHDPDCA